MLRPSDFQSYQTGFLAVRRRHQLWHESGLAMANFAGLARAYRAADVVCGVAILEVMR